MFTLSITPRFYETDAFGHINNTVITGWFETAREPVFRLFNPSMEIKNLPLILARVEVDFVAQIYYGADIEIKTWIEQIGNSSLLWRMKHGKMSIALHVARLFRCILISAHKNQVVSQINSVTSYNNI